MPGPIETFLADDHARIDGLLALAERGGGSIDPMSTRRTTTAVCFARDGRDLARARASQPLPIGAFKLNLVGGRVRIMPVRDLSGRPFAGPGVVSAKPSSPIVARFAGKSRA
jgi:hypothetical protein